MPVNHPLTLGYFAAALTATAGIALFTGVQFAVISLWRKREDIYLSYAGVCLCIAGLAFGNALLDASTTLPAAVQALRLMIASAVVSFVPFAIFIGSYTGRPAPRILLGLALLQAAIFSWHNLTAPGTLFFSRIEAVPPLGLPWGEQLFGLGGEPSPWGMTFHAFTYGMFLWALWRAIEQFRHGDRTRASLLATCLAAQFAALLWGDIMIDQLGIRSPYLDSFAFLPFVLLMGFSLAASRVQAERALGESEHRYRTLFNQVDEGFCILEQLGPSDKPEDFRFIAANPAFTTHTGARDVVGKPVGDVFPDLAPYWTDVLARVLASGTPCHFEHGGADSERALDHYACRLQDARQRRVALVIRDVTARKRYEERQRMLVNELNHRVKNTLATVQSIAMQSLRDTDDPAVAYQHFEGRLLALSKVHDVLTRESWMAASLDTVVEQALAPYRDLRGQRLHARGVPVRLPPAYALAFAMAIHELGTNAAKYGALSGESGEITIQWHIEPTTEGRVLSLQWTERGGPPVVRPERRGFGLRLLERGLAHEIGGQVRLSFPATGVVCTIRTVLRGPLGSAPLAHLLDSGARRTG